MSKASDIKRMLHFTALADRPVMIWGPPGGGKSSVARQFLTDWTKKVYVIKIKKGEPKTIYKMTTTALEPIDLRGLMSVREGKTFWNPPNFLPHEENCGLLIDDLTNGHPQVLTALYSLILDGYLGDYVLPKGTVIIATGNDETHKSYATRMPAALAARFVHMELDFDIENWIDNAIDMDFDLKVIAFGRAFPKLINAFDPTQGKAQPLARTWEFVSDIMKQNPDADLVLPLVQGTVGKGAALEFQGFLEIYNSEELPDVFAVLKNPLALKVMPSKPSVMYAFIGAMAKWVKENSMDSFITVAERMLAEKLSEYAVTMVNDATRYNGELKNTKAYISWITKHQSLYV